jgi:enoyl-CoA hydratase/carnithine racemase
MVTLIENPRWVRLTFGTPVLAVAELDALIARLANLAHRSRPVPVVLASSHASIYLAGAHLLEIANLDETSCAGYARRGREVVARIRRLPAPTVAAVHGSCSGGGFDLVMACDLIVAGRSATFSHPGVRRGLVTGWGGTVALPAVVSRSSAVRTVLEGTALTAEELADRGLVVVVDDPVVEAATELAVALAWLHPGRLAAWRRLRDGGEDDRCGILPSPAIIESASPPVRANRSSSTGAPDPLGRRPGRPHDQDDPARR